MSVRDSVKELRESNLDLQPLWRAQWIWDEGDRVEANTYAYFRRVFFVEKSPKRAMLHITADTQYRVWINCEEIGGGPVAEDPRWQSYDSYFVQNYLRQGDNAIAVLCYYSGVGTGGDLYGINISRRASAQKRASHDSRPGFLCQLEYGVGGKNTIVASDRNWKACVSRCWEQDVPTIDDRSFVEIYDAANEPVGWKSHEFDDSSWGGVVVLTGQQGLLGCNVDPSKTINFPWCMLELRDIPYLKSRKITPKALITCGEVIERSVPGKNENIALRMSLEGLEESKFTRIESCEALVSGGEIRIIPFDHNTSYDDFSGVRSATMILDFGELFNGRLQLDIQAPGGGMVDIAYAQRLVNGRPEIYTSRLSAADRYITKEGSQTWQSFDWRHFRYIQLTFRNLLLPLQLNNLTAVAEEYDAEKTGHFECDNEVLNWLWNAGVETTRVCTHDRYMDCARERRQHISDVSDKTVTG